MEKKEEIFVAVMDLLERYLALHQALGAAMRTAFLNLSASRLAMGPDRVSSLQFPAHMQATSRVVLAGGDGLELVQCDPGLGSRAALFSESSKAVLEAAPATASSNGKAAGAQAAYAAAASSNTGCGSRAANGATDCSSGGAEGPDALAGAVGGLRLREEGSSILQELAEKYHCSFDTTADDDATSESFSEAAGEESQGTQHQHDRHRQQPQKKPLQWFGELVAPSLREAEKNFSEVLRLALEAATVQRKLMARLMEYRQLQAAVVQVS